MTGTQKARDLKTAVTAVVGWMTGGGAEGLYQDLLSEAGGLRHNPGAEKCPFGLALLRRAGARTAATKRVTPHW